MARKPHVNVDLSGKFQIHGHHNKDKVVIHETISHDHAGLSDIKAIASYLGPKGYGIHCIVDQEGKSGYSRYDRAIYWHAGGDNKNTIGIEMVSYIPALKVSRWKRLKVWLSRERQLHKTARWIAYYCDKHRIPIRYSNGGRAGVCSHWDISNYNKISGGHWDAWPKHRGGHFPMKRLIRLAQGYHSGALKYLPLKKYKLGTST